VALNPSKKTLRATTSKPSSKETYFDLCCRGIVELNGGRAGVSRPALKAFVKNHREHFHGKLFNATLRKAVKSGALLPHKGSFKLSKASLRKMEVHHPERIHLFSYVGKKVSKDFPGHGTFVGTVTSCNLEDKLWRVVYNDGDSEDVNERELLGILKKKMTAKKDGRGSRPPKNGQKKKLHEPASTFNAPKMTTVPSQTTPSVDPHCGLSPENYFVKVDPTSGPWECALAFRDLEKNSDKFYILQIVEGKDGSSRVVRRYGRTGHTGKVDVDCVENEDEAVKMFTSLFRSKTGNDWASGNFVVKEGKYDFLKKDYQRKREEFSMWQYYVNDGVDGKEVGWYNYDAGASETVDEVYHQWLDNTSYAVRCVESGHFRYQVNFGTMTQTNIAHHGRKQRQVRRVTDRALAKDGANR